MMTNSEVRKYFKDAWLTYADITSGDICILVQMLNRNIKIACKNHEMSVDSMRLSEKIKSKYTENGLLKECYIFINSHYFTQRECISFNADKFIGFAGWADDSNTKPIIEAFIEWVDYLKGEKK